MSIDFFSQLALDIYNSGPKFADSKSGTGLFV